MRKTMSVLALAAVTLPSPAFACGGFFCNRDAPVVQDAERIVFGVDEESRTVTAHVQITYAGESDDFAWIVPVPRQPNLFVSSEALFLNLASLTQPQYPLSWETFGVCDVDFVTEEDVAYAEDQDGGGDDGVTVVSEQVVGPYETVTLKADDATELLDWLQAAGYDLPDDLDPVLQPYVAEDQYFVALKLAAGQDTGDLSPLGMSYSAPGGAASIPLQLTSIAASPDMPLEVYLLGSARAVPDNYLHVRLNDAAIDWFGETDNHGGVVSRAADEAGGQAFATDFSGSTDPFRGTLYTEGQYDTAVLATLTSPVAWVDEIIAQGFPATAEMLEIFTEFIPMPTELVNQGLSDQDFYNCLACYDDYVDDIAFDPIAATEAVETRIVAGLVLAEELFQTHPHITRLSTSLDPSEMTVDPLFVFNPDVEQDLTNVHSGSVEVHCGAGEGWDGAERKLILPDGRAILLPSENWLANHNDMDLATYMAELATPAALVIEDLSASGEGTILFDYRDEAAEEARRFNGPGCGGCSTGAPTWGSFGMLAAVAGVLRRRRH